MPHVRRRPFWLDKIDPSVLCDTPTVLGLVGNEWEPAKNECFSTGQNGGVL